MPAAANMEYDEFFLVIFTPLYQSSLPADEMHLPD